MKPGTFLAFIFSLPLCGSRGWPSPDSLVSYLLVFLGLVIRPPCSGLKKRHPQTLKMILFQLLGSGIGVWHWRYREMEHGLQGEDDSWRVCSMGKFGWWKSVGVMKFLSQFGIRFPDLGHVRWDQRKKSQNVHPVSFPEMESRSLCADLTPS